MAKIWDKAQLSWFWFSKDHLNPTTPPPAGPFWDVLKVSLSPSKLDASTMLRTYNLNLMLNDLVPKEGADMGEKKDKWMAEAFRYVKEQVADEGTSIRDASLCFADHLKTIMDMVYDHASLTRSTDFCLDLHLSL